MPLARRRIGEKLTVIGLCVLPHRELIWNRLSADLKLLWSTDSFRREMKTFLF